MGRVDHEDGGDQGRRKDSSGRRQCLRRGGRRPGRAGTGRSRDERRRQRCGIAALRREDQAGRVHQRRRPGSEARHHRLVQKEQRWKATDERRIIVCDCARHRRCLVHPAGPLGHDDAGASARAGDRRGRERVSPHRRPGAIDGIAQARQVPVEPQALSGENPRRGRDLPQSGAGGHAPEARGGREAERGQRTPRSAEGCARQVLQRRHRASDGEILSGKRRPVPLRRFCQLLRQDRDAGLDRLSRLSGLQECVSQPGPCRADHAEHVGRLRSPRDGTQQHRLHSHERRGVEAGICRSRKISRRHGLHPGSFCRTPLQELRAGTPQADRSGTCLAGAASGQSRTVHDEHAGQ